MNVPEQHDMLAGADDAKDAPRLIARVSSIAVKAAFPFIAADEIRLYLCGVNIRPLESGGVVVIATDGHRFLMVRDDDIEKETSREIVLVQGWAGELSRLFGRT